MPRKGACNSGAVQLLYTDTILKHIDCTRLWEARKTLSEQDSQRQRDRLQISACSVLCVLPKHRLGLNKVLVFLQKTAVV